MLRQIYVKNFILMDLVHLEFDDHMSSFTGETGAGKSLLMDAIGILKGDRIRSDMVKEGCAKAIIEGVFEIPRGHRIYDLLTEAGYELDDDTLIVTREITREGKSSARINHRTTTVAFLKEVVSSLVDIHSQHDTQYLLNSKYHLSLLDEFCHDDILRMDVANAYHIYKRIRDDLEKALSQDYNEDDLEFLTFQLNEIDQAHLKDGELEELEKQQKRMMAFEKISSKLQIVYQWIEEDDGSNAKLYQAYREISDLHEDEAFENMTEKLSEAYYMIEDVMEEIHHYLEHMEYDEEMFHELQERIFLLTKLYRKYGGSYASVMEKRSELEQKIDLILHRQDFIAKQTKRQDEAYETYQAKAKELSQIRKKQACILETEVLKQLKDLYLPHARFVIDIRESEGNASGIDQVEFLISMNAGERLKPLHTTASGGELSRFMLGMKTVFTHLQGIDTIIFDEIDTGVSGKVALAIGRKMKELSQNTQVFCVTHLAAVAACADHHYIVEKKQDDQKTSTNIHELNEEERIAQLAIIASNSTSASALAAAKELLEIAQK